MISNALRVGFVSARGICLVLLATAGCASPETAESAPPESVPATSDGAESEVRAALIGAVAGARFGDDDTIIASPRKLGRILANIGLAPGAPRPREGAIKCLPTYTVQFVDKAGSVLADAGFSCAGEDRKNAAGSVTIGARSYLIVAKDLDALDAIVAEPRTVADVLFRVDRVTLGQPGSRSFVETSKASVVGTFAAALDPEQAPDPKAAVPRCVPTRVLGFYAGVRELAIVSFACSEGERGRVTGRFMSNDEATRGAVTLDAGKVFDLEAQLR